MQGLQAPFPGTHSFASSVFTSQAGGNEAPAAIWPSLTPAHDNVQGERLSLPMALLRIGNFPEAPAYFPLNVTKLNWFTCLFPNLSLAWVMRLCPDNVGFPERYKACRGEGATT